MKLSGKNLRPHCQKGEVGEQQEEREMAKPKEKVVTATITTTNGESCKSKTKLNKLTST